MREEAAVGQLWDLYQEWRDSQSFPPSTRRVASAIGMSPTALANWRSPLSRLPDAENLARFSEMLRLPYPTVLDAALHDSGYLPKPPRLEPVFAPAASEIELEDDFAEAARTTPTGEETPGQRRRRLAQEAGEESQDPGEPS